MLSSIVEKQPFRPQKISNKKWVLFDGDCGLCHWAVRFIAPKDRNKNFCFVPLNSPFGIQLLIERGLYLEEKTNVGFPLDSVILIDPDKAYYIKSEAVIQILKLLPHWYLIGLLIQCIPSKISDFCYDYTAKNRTKWFGRKQSCNLNDFPENTCFKTDD